MRVMAEELLSKKERRELKRQEKTLAQERAARKSTLKRITTIGSAAVIGIGVLVAFVAYANRRQQTLPGQFIPEMASRVHIAVGASHEPYSSNPPTSGPHYPTTVKAGVHEDVIADEYLVHNMEHGHVIIWYQCGDTKPFDQGCKDERGTLKKMVEEEFKSWKVVLMPRPKMETRFALTAWTRLDTFNDFDEARVRRFIKAFRNRGPEATAE